MGNRLAEWFLKLSIRWKLQFSFFLVTMITTIYNRMLASHELTKMVDIARSGGASPDILEKLEANHGAYIFNSFWESGIEFILQFFIIGLLATLFVRPIRMLCSALQSVQQGDLTQGVENRSLDEIGQLERSFNDLLAKLNTIMREIHDNGKRMEQSAYQIAKISRDIAEVGKAEQSRSAEVSAATEQLRAVSETVRGHAQATADRAKEIEEQAHEGIRMVRKNIEGMTQTVEDVHHASEEINELEQAAEKIHEIIGVIKTIAEQTNLLALNAAIEAARAGDQGRGFAVVADEVRKLAECTTRSASEVSEIINSLSQNVNRVTRSMGVVVDKVHENQTVAGETENVIKTIVAEMTETSASNHKIAAVSADQLGTLNLLQRTLDDLFSTLDVNSNKVETTAAIGENLHGVTGRLNKLMSDFQFNRHSVIEPDQHERRLYPRAQCNVLVVARQGGARVEGISRNLSLTGLGLNVSKPLEDSQKVSLEILLPKEDLRDYEDQAPIKLTGQIMWERGGPGEYRYGIKFLDLNTVLTGQLRQCLDYFNRRAEYDSPLATFPS